MLGDVVISLDTAARQAAERRYALLDEARVLLVHGVLHLMGYDHEEGEQSSCALLPWPWPVVRTLGARRAAADGIQS